jgi:hypothetical protein
LGQGWIGFSEDDGNQLPQAQYDAQGALHASKVWRQKPHLF